MKKVTICDGGGEFKFTNNQKPEKGKNSQNTITTEITKFKAGFGREGQSYFYSTIKYLQHTALKFLTDKDMEKLIFFEN